MDGWMDGCLRTYMQCLFTYGTYLPMFISTYSISSARLDCVWAGLDWADSTSP